MRSSSLCTRLGLLLMLMTLVANQLMQEGGAGHLTRLDANAFPHQVEDWRSISDRPLAPFLHTVLPTATVIDRIYSNAQGEEVELALVAAGTGSDAHDPEMCLPGTGWTLQKSQPRTLDGQAMRSAQARQNGQELSVLYWFDMPATPTANWLIWTQRLRLKMQEHGTILVRLTTPGAPQSEAVLRAFAHQLLPALAVWKQTGIIGSKSLSTQ